MFKFKVFLKAFLVLLFFHVFCALAFADYREGAMDDLLRKVEIEQDIASSLPGTAKSNRPLELQDYISENEASPESGINPKGSKEGLGFFDAIKKAFGHAGSEPSSQIVVVTREQALELALDSQVQYFAGQPTPAQQKVRTFAEEVGILDPLRKISVPSKIRFSAQASFPDNRYKSYVDYILPLYYPAGGNTLLFFNPKSTWSMPGPSRESNMGFGLRQIFNDSFILGAHFFYDKKLSVNKRWFSQRGYGLEYLSEPLDFRFNYYDPVTQPKMLDDGYDFAETGLIHWRSYEEALEGYDLEVGFPVTGIKTRFYLGGFFYNSRLGDDLNGARIRTETAIGKYLSLDLSYEAKSRGKSTFTSGLRLNVPFELGFTRMPVSFSSYPELPYIKDRIFERVVRDIDIQTQVPKEPQKEDVPGIDMIYVNNTNTSGVEDGTLTFPYSSIDNALASPRYGDGKYVYIFKGDGTDTGYTGSYTLLDNVVFWGSGTAAGYKGLPTYGYPVLSENGDMIIRLANGNAVRGLTLRGDTRWAAIVGEGISNVVIEDNIIKDNSIGIDLQNWWSGSYASGWTVRNNYFSNNSYDCGFEVSGPGTSVSGITFSNNTSSLSGNSFFITANSGVSASDITVSNNTITGSSDDALNFSIASLAVVSNITVSNNTLSNTSGYDAIRFVGDAANVSNLNFLDNNINTVTGGYDGIHLDLSGHTGITYSDITFKGNTISGASEEGIHVVTSGLGAGNAPSVSGLTFAYNTISDNTFGGIYLHNEGGAAISNVNFYRNIIKDNDRNGVYFRKIGSTFSNVDMGNGPLGSIGYNSIFHNGDGFSYSDIHNDSGINSLRAENNYWGGGILNWIGANTVDYDPYFDEDPN